MKTIIFLILMGSITLCRAQSDEEAIRAVVSSAYIEGIQNRGTSEQIRAGFDRAFTMLRVIDNEVKPYPIEEWIAALEKSKKENPTTTSRAEGKFISIDITGSAAVVKLQLHRDGKHVFTDYLSLYKFSEGWKIVSKIFYRHP